MNAAAISGGRGHGETRRRTHWTWVELLACNSNGREFTLTRVAHLLWAMARKICAVSQRANWKPMPKATVLPKRLSTDSRTFLRRPDRSRAKRGAPEGPFPAICRLIVEKGPFAPVGTSGQLEQDESTSS